MVCNFLKVAHNFARFLMRCNAECGELAEYNMAGQQTVLMSGPEAQEAFLKGLDKQLSRIDNLIGRLPGRRSHGHHSGQAAA